MPSLHYHALYYGAINCDAIAVGLFVKRILRLDKLRLRGISGTRDEFLLAATAQNLRRMVKWLMPVTEKRKSRSVEAHLSRGNGEAAPATARPAKGARPGPGGAEFFNTIGQ